ncbi:hypothetical protein OO013_00750 [Mangrovivirga sp. M17]|uniref:Uncharacterized protein n=1 Tax=Mangrovivirga halotolerans TaxID=2993936 RepID=A0ABT3RLH8_9BACT|nr:hypothetical protein [Mangrovivirga halotolerans]MCX2742368.1 hypothetical protein [Mangrovivirga halotolerans]
MRYTIINIGFIVSGFLTSYLVDLAKLFNLSDAHDQGLTNLFFCIFIFTLMGLITSVKLYRKSKSLVIFSILLIVALVAFALYFNLF